MTDHFDDLALKLLPPGRVLRGGVANARKEIAKTIRDEVKKAEARRLEASDPELAAERARLESERKRLEALAQTKENEFRTKQESARADHRALADREAALLERESRLKELIIAIRDWEAWRNGAGDPDELTIRYRAVSVALKEYLSQ